MNKTKLMSKKKKKVLVLIGMYKTIPPLRKNHLGMEALIYEPIKLLEDEHIQVISFWYKALANITYDKSKYHHVKVREFAIIKKIPYRFKKKLFGFVEPKRIVYYSNLIIQLWRRRPDVVITHADPKLAMLASRAYPNAEHIFYYHGSVLENSFSKKSWDAFSLRINKLIILCDNANEGLENKFEKNSIKHKVIMNAINQDIASPKIKKDNRIHSRQYFGIKETEIAVIYMGRIAKSKGLYEMIQGFIMAYNKNRNLRLLIAGDPARESQGEHKFYESLKVLSKKLPSDIIKFVGFVGDERKMLMFSAGDIAVLTSSRQAGEGNSLFLMESMAYGLACVATDVGGNGEVLGKTGILIPPDNLSKGLSVAFGYLSSRNERIKFGSLAAQRAKTHFTFERLASELNDFIRIEP